MTQMSTVTDRLNTPLKSSRDSHHNDGRKENKGTGKDNNGGRQKNGKHDDTRSRNSQHNRQSKHRNGRDPKNRQPQDQRPLTYTIPKQPKDENIRFDVKDPRGNDPTHRLTTQATKRGAGRNTESFDPASTLVRPDFRVHIGSNRLDKFNKKLKHDDVVIIPELFGAEDDWTLYYQLLEEINTLQESSSINSNKNGRKGPDWIPWHEGAHLITENPQGSPMFGKIIDRLCEYFCIRKESIGTRLNWYTDSSDWKPFHHDSAAYNPQRAKNQNITVGVSFGATRELAFIHANPFGDGQGKCKVYFPQVNNGVFSFGRDVNIRWKHGINALPPEEQDDKGRISIIVWGLAQNVIDEEGSPPLLGSNGKGPHAATPFHKKYHPKRRDNHHHCEERDKKMNG